MKLLGILLMSLIHPAYAATECFGPMDAKKQLIYLHGIDSKDPGELELLNRSRLKFIAESLNIRIALPRSETICRGDQLCWNTGADTPELVLGRLQRARELAADCLSSTAPIHWIGFSSGGYLLNKLIRFCLDIDAASLLSVGAAGTAAASDPADLSTCTPLKLLVSRTEITRPDTESFYSSMRAKGALIELHYFEGGHELPLAETLQLLR